jgi:hypothetical protein
MVCVLNRDHRFPYQPKLTLWQRLPIWLWAFLAHEILVTGAYLVPYPDQPGVLHRAFSASAHFWFQWDALWYIAISRYGYAHLPLVPPLAGTAFFPWLPVLIHAIGVFAAWGLTQLSVLFSLWLLARLAVRLRCSSNQTALGVFLFAVNPAAVYFSTLYAEPWTIVFTLASLELGHHRRWILAAIAGLLAATTQATGILVGLFPLIAFLQSLRSGSVRRAAGPFLWGIGPFLGLSSYVTYLALRFHRPLSFATVQSTPYWKGTWRWPWQQWYQGLATAVLQHRLDATLLALWIAVTLFVVGALILARTGESWSSLESVQSSVYAIAGLLVSLSFYHGNSPLYSTVRIVSIYFPLYLGLARARRGFAIGALIFFAALAFYGAMLFTHHWWYQ